MKAAFDKVYEGMTVLVTGHTGFKGSWLSIWLNELGANVVGYSLDSPTTPSLFETTDLKNKITHIHGDICDYAKLKEAIAQHRPGIIFHLAAQAIVIDSYNDPKSTFEVNSQGTVNVLEAARGIEEVRAIVLVTTDKCYENKEWGWGYRENDPLGGNDPYSASKAMAEIAIHSYRQSFFQRGGPAVASARAGNVIGGGDFSSFRIIPDTMKALMEEKTVFVRNPESVRPWLNVLDPLSGYLWLGANLLQKGATFAQAWNFGPKEQRGIPVRKLVEKAIELWGQGEWNTLSQSSSKPEMKMLRLCWDKAAQDLEWEPLYDWQEALKETVDWFKAYQTDQEMYDVCVAHINDYVKKGNQLDLKWTKESCALHPLL